MPRLHKSLPRKCSAAPKYRYTATQLTQLWGRHRRAPGGLHQPVKSRLRSTHSGVDKTSPAPWTRRQSSSFFCLSLSLSLHLKPLRSGRSTGADVQVDRQKGVPPARSFLRRETDCALVQAPILITRPEALGKRSYPTLKSRSSGIKQQTLERMRTNWTCFSGPVKRTTF